MHYHRENLVGPLYHDSAAASFSEASLNQIRIGKKAQLWKIPICQGAQFLGRTEAVEEEADSGLHFQLELYLFVCLFVCLRGSRLWFAFSIGILSEQFHFECGASVGGNQNAVWSTKKLCHNP